MMAKMWSGRNFYEITFLNAATMAARYSVMPGTCYMARDLEMSVRIEITPAFLSQVVGLMLFMFLKSG